MPETPVIRATVASVKASVESLTVCRRYVWWILAEIDPVSVSTLPIGHPFSDVPAGRQVSHFPDPLLYFARLVAPATSVVHPAAGSGVNQTGVLETCCEPNNDAA